jgi:hypothetical protein
MAMPRTMWASRPSQRIEIARFSPLRTGPDWAGPGSSPRSQLAIALINTSGRSAEAGSPARVERIPFAETRNYVQRVIENLEVYRGRFGESTAAFEPNLIEPASAEQRPVPIEVDLSSRN